MAKTDSAGMFTLCHVPEGIYDLVIESPGASASTQSDVDVLDKAVTDLGAIDVSTLWHQDADGDGFGNPSVTLQQCESPAGYVLDDTDCYDGNADANPDQTTGFQVDRGDGSYDYNCDSLEMPVTGAIEHICCYNFNCGGIGGGCQAFPCPYSPTCGQDIYYSNGCTGCDEGCEQTYVNEGLPDCL